MRVPASHGTGQVIPEDFAFFGEGVVIEPGALVFHPEHVRLGDRVYVGHYAVLNGYHRGHLHVGPGSWIGPHALLHGAGGLEIGAEVGIGAGVRIITSAHADPGSGQPMMRGEIIFGSVSIGDGCDLGVNAVVLPGVSLGAGVQVGAGAVVSRDLPDRAVAAGVPARVLRTR